MRKKAEDQEKIDRLRGCDESLDPPSYEGLPSSDDIQVRP